MLIVKIYYLKIPILLLIGLSVFVSPGNSSVIPRTDGKAFNTIYKQILKMRTLPFEDCGSTYDILYLSISSCNTIPCEMRRGSKSLVNVIFDDAGKNASFLKHRVHWIFNAIKTDATITPDPCDGDHECIINSNDGKSYNATIYVQGSLPCIRGTMLWEAVDERGSGVICFRIPIVITA